MTTTTPTPRVPERPRLEGLEDRWSARWADDGIYAFDRSRTRDEIYSIDSPPPTVSGRLHVGHCFSYTHTDLVARFHRMRGREVFYPMGWDDNGLNTERRVQLSLGITCDPSLPYDADFVPPGPHGPTVPCSRRNFVEACERVTAELERAYRDLWTRLGLSVDWDLHYTTIGPTARRVSQIGFLRLLAAGKVERRDAPTLWDVDYRTAVAQAELDEREVPGAYHRLRFGVPGADADLLVDTTRPELLPACVAVVVHPDDDRFRELVGREAVTPLFAVPVPVLAHPLAEPDKGTGAAMVCTFGDTTDIEWWRDLDLPLRPVIAPDGTLAPIDWSTDGWRSTDPDHARSAYAGLVGRSPEEARRAVVGLLRDTGDLLGDPQEITHPVKFWENGHRPLEILTTPQWFVRVRDEADVWRARGEDLHWHPPHMHQRYRDWVDGLAADWNISRQRFFGVPFPLWYPIRADGTVDDDHPIVPGEDRLPIDPSIDVPDGYDAALRDQPGGFTAEPDVMDTWATSSLTPQLAGGWPDDPDLFRRVFPYDLRPQAHEIIRTWLFTTVVRSHLHEGVLPWRDAAISGFVVDPDRKKLSKSRGNADDEPMALLERWGADAVRYWAAGARLGADTTVDHNRMKVGRRLATKLLHVSRFVLTVTGRAGTDRRDAPTWALDRAWSARLATAVSGATEAFEDFDHAEALRRVEDVFWTFCDDVVELVKSRAYGDLGPDGAASAHAMLVQSLAVLQRLLAPFLPFAAEEAWSWWHEGSIHRAAWPGPDDLDAGETPDPAMLESALAVLAAVRQAKSEAGAGMRTPVAKLEIVAPESTLDTLATVHDDLAAATNAKRIVTRPGDGMDVHVRLGA